MSLPSAFEGYEASWLKRYLQRHYAYRDSHRKTTTVLTALQALGLYAQSSASVLYVFGTNARTINIRNWPLQGDHGWALSCYAREVMFLCDQDVWVRLISINPEYLRQYVVNLGGGPTVTAQGVIVETEVFIPLNTMVTLHPTLGYAVVFRADSVTGTLDITVEGNVEGSD